MVVGGSGKDEVHGGDGDDRIYTYDGGDMIFPGDWAAGDDKIYIGDTHRNGASTVDGTEFWADSEANALNKLYVGDTNGCYTVLTEVTMRDWFDDAITGCERADFKVEVSTHYNTYKLYGATGTLCRSGSLICPSSYYH